MAASTDVRPSTQSPFLVLSIPDLQMPLFQRRYGWGGHGLELKAVEYVKQFVANPDANKYCGQIFFYSALPFELRTGATTPVYVGDGQHRLVTLVLFAQAMRDRLDELLGMEQSDADREVLENYCHNQYLGVLLNSTLRVVLDDAGQTPRVHDHLREYKERYRQLTTRIEALNSPAELAVTRLTGEAKKERNAARKAELDALKAQLRDLRQDCVFSSYLSLLNYIPAKNGSEFANIALPFFTRMKDFSANLVHLHSTTGTSTLDDVLEGDAYSMYLQINAHNNPLTIGDLFKAYVSTKGATSPLNAYTKEDSKRRVFLRKLGISDYTDIVDFLATYLSPGKSVDAYTWLKTKMFGSPNSRMVLHSMHEALSHLAAFEEDLSRAEPRIASLYELYFASVRTPRAVVIAQAYAAKAKGETVRLEDLLRLLVLLELMPLYIPSTNKRARGRDMQALKGNAVAAGLAAVMRHFEATSFGEVAQRLELTIAQKPFGLAAYRKLGKLLLVLADYRKPGSDVSVQSWKTYHYEHLVPLKIDGALNSEGLPQAAQAELTGLAMKPTAQREAVLNRLGNAALLAGRENKGLGNKSPWEKLQQTRINRLDNAWWPTHKSFLEGTAGVMGATQIDARSQELANNIGAFLLSFDAETIGAAEMLVTGAGEPATPTPAPITPQAMALAPVETVLGADIPVELLMSAPPAGLSPDDMAEDLQQDDDATRRRAPNTELIVHTKQGTIRGKSAVATLVAAVEAAGLANVAALNLKINGEPLVSSTLSPNYTGQSKKVGNCYINTASNNKKKVELIEAISDRLNLGWTVDQQIKGVKA